MVIHTIYSMYSINVSLLGDGLVLSCGAYLGQSEPAQRGHGIGRTGAHQMEHKGAMEPMELCTTE